MASIGIPGRAVDDARPRLRHPRGPPASDASRSRQCAGWLAAGLSGVLAACGGRALPTLALALAIEHLGALTPAVAHHVAGGRPPRGLPVASLSHGELAVVA